MNEDEFPFRFQMTVKRAKKEIARDIRVGLLPADVSSFSELHDYVDANYYGGAFEDATLDLSQDIEMAFWGAVQECLDRWLARGRGPGY